MAFKVECSGRWDGVEKIGTAEEVKAALAGKLTKIGEGAYRNAYVNEDRTVVYKIGKGYYGNDMARDEFETMNALWQKCGTYRDAATPTSLWTATEWYKVEGGEEARDVKVVAMVYMPGHAYGPGGDDMEEYGSIPAGYEPVYAKNERYITRAVEELERRTGIELFDMHDWNWRLDHNGNPHITDAAS